MALYEPKSDLLKAFGASAEAVSDSPPSEENLRLLIRMTRDEDRSNRDWAAFYLSICVLDTPEVRSALMHAANDSDEYVRGEAIVGLAERDPDIALPFVQRALSANWASQQIFEAAGLLAHPSLVEDLRQFTQPSDDVVLDKVISEALQACESGEPVFPRKSFIGPM